MCGKQTFWYQLVLSLLLIGCLSPTTRAATIAYWKFEDSPGFLNDSSGNGNALSVVGSVTQATLPASGRGANFYNPIPLTGEPNTKSADFEGTSDYLRNTSISSSPSSGFTYETFLHWEDSINNNESYSEVLLYTGTLSLQIRTDGTNGTDPDGEFMLAYTDSTSSTRKYIYSGFSPAMDTDYYFGFSMDLASSTANFYIKDLTNGGPLQTIARTHGGMGSFPASNFVDIGSASSSPASFDLDGLLDEVRFSDTALSVSELLISASTSASVPEPGSSALVGFGLCALVRIRRRRRK